MNISLNVTTELIVHKLTSGFDAVAFSNMLFMANAEYVFQSLVFGVALLASANMKLKVWTDDVFHPAVSGLADGAL